MFGAALLDGSFADSPNALAAAGARAFLFVLATAAGGSADPTGPSLVSRVCFPNAEQCPGQVAKCSDFIAVSATLGPSICSKVIEVVIAANRFKING